MNIIIIKNIKNQISILSSSIVTSEKRTLSTKNRNERETLFSLLSLFLPTAKKNRNISSWNIIRNKITYTFYQFLSRKEKWNGEKKNRDSTFRTIRVYFINLSPQSRKEIDTIRLVGPSLTSFRGRSQKCERGEEVERSE